MAKQVCCEYVSKYMPKDIVNIVISYAFDQWLKVYIHIQTVRESSIKNMYHMIYMIRLYTMY